MLSDDILGFISVYDARFEDALTEMPNSENADIAYRGDHRIYSDEAPK